MLFEIDLSQAESRVCDYMSNEVEMIKAYEQKLDVYKMLGTKIFNCSYDEVLDTPGSSGFSRYSMRKCAKEAKLQLQYGCGPRTFAERMDLPVNVATDLWEKHLSSGCPNLRKVYWPYCEEMVKQNKHRDLFHKLYRFYGLWGDDLKRRAYDFVPQSTIGRIINDWGLLFIWNDPVLRKAAQIMIQEHDSVKYQVRDNDWAIDQMVVILMSIVESLERPLYFKNPYLEVNGAVYECEFIIPCEVAAGYNMAAYDPDDPEANPDGLRELDLEGDVEKQLEEIKESHYERSSRSVSQ